MRNFLRVLVFAAIMVPFMFVPMSFGQRFLVVMAASLVSRFVFALVWPVAPRIELTPNAIAQPEPPATDVREA